MFGRGSEAVGQVSTAMLMALEGKAMEIGRDLPSLAERPGTNATRKRGQGHEIREVRPYADGDDLRHLDPSATARTGSPQIRSFHEDRENSLILIADFRRPMLWATRGRLKSVAAAEALMMAGWRASLAGGSVGAFVLTDLGPSQQLPRPRHTGMALVANCLARAHALALETAETQPRPLDAELGPVARQVPRGAQILLATGLDHVGPNIDAALAALRGRGPLTLLLVEDRFETAPPRQALPAALAEGERAWARFDTLPDVRDARAASLTIPGQRVQRISSSEEAR